MSEATGPALGATQAPNDSDRALLDLQHDQLSYSVPSLDYILVVRIEVDEHDAYLAPVPTVYYARRI